MARPPRSIAAIVLSKPAGSGSEAMRSISRSRSSIADSSAGLKSSSLTLSNGGTPPYGPLHGAISGLRRPSFVSIGRSGLGLLVARLVLRVRRIEAREGGALLDLLHDPSLEALLLRRGRHHLVDEGRGNYHRAVVVGDDPVV